MWSVTPVLFYLLSICHSVHLACVFWMPFLMAGLLCWGHFQNPFLIHCALNVQLVRSCHFSQINCALVTKHLDISIFFSPWLFHSGPKCCLCLCLSVSHICLFHSFHCFYSCVGALRFTYGLMQPSPNCISCSQAPNTLNYPAHSLKLYHPKTKINFYTSSWG